MSFDKDTKHSIRKNAIDLIDQYENQLKKNDLAEQSLKSFYIEGSEDYKTALDRINENRSLCKKNISDMKNILKRYC